MPERIRKKKKMSSFEMIAFGFAGVILLGAIILMLPISSSAGVVTPFDKTLFTATSAVCVTGLVVVDTGSYWSAFGQAVILLLIQTGGLGVITVVASFSMVSGRKISLMQRSTMQDAISSDSAGSSFPADRSSDCPSQGFSLKIHRSLFLMRQPPHLTMRVKK